MQTIHLEFEGVVGARERVVNFSDGVNTTKYDGAKATKFLNSFGDTDKLLVTAAHSADAVVLDLAKRGVDIYHTHWHSTGIPKGLPSEEIALRFSQLPEDSLRKFIPRADIAELRTLVAARRAIVEFRKAATLRLSAIQRTLSTGLNLPPELEQVSDEIALGKKQFETPVDKKIFEMAATIPECVAFNQVAAIKAGWHSAAAFVAYTGDVSRFPQVASLWHYCGYHVVDGKAPSRRKGHAQDWNGKVRAALWSMADSMRKTNNEKWRPIYDAYRTIELERHDRICPNCKTKEGHCGARALRRVIKDVVKEYYLVMNHGVPENQMRGV